MQMSCAGIYCFREIIKLVDLNSSLPVQKAHNSPEIVLSELIKFSVIHPDFISIQ